VSHFGGWRREGKASPRKRHERGRMNGLEEDYSSHLALLKHAGEIAAFDFEPLKLRLGDACYYEVDFLVQAADASMEVHEVKGFWRDDARVKFRVSAEQHPWLRFFAVTREKGGAWVVEPAWKEDRERAAVYGAVRNMPEQGVGGVAGAARAQGRRVAAPRKNV
jgi:hypothetical protein